MTWVRIAKVKGIPHRRRNEVLRPNPPNVNLDTHSTRWPLTTRTGSIGSTFLREILTEYAVSPRRMNGSQFLSGRGPGRAWPWLCLVLLLVWALGERGLAQAPIIDSFSPP